MALKCFLATAGRVTISPIFLPILNYAPEGESFCQTLIARWTQAKRHALGFSEIVYFHDHFPRVLNKISDRNAKIYFLWRTFFLWLKLLMIHLIMATFWLVGPFNAACIAYFIQHLHPQDLNINSWTFLVNCVIQLVTFMSFTGVCLISVMVYESQKKRIDGSDDPKMGLRWRRPMLHGITNWLESAIWVAPFFTLAAWAEWIAAVKTARTHKFDY